MKKKTGAWLRWSNRTTVPEAILVETRAPQADTPAEFFADVTNEPRAPWGTAWVQSQAARRA